MSKNNPNAIDWAAIKTEYITSTASYRKLAEKYGVSYRYMSVRGRSEGWVEARRKYQEGVTDKIIEKVADERANRDSQKLLLLQKSADLMAEAILKVFDDASAFNRFIVSDGNFSMEERVFNKVDTKAMREITASIKDLAGVMRNVYNLPTDIEQKTYELAKERLELDKTKTAAGVGDEEDTGVIFLPSAESEDNNE